MSLNYIAIGQRIKALRSKRCMSQSVLSERIDKTPTYISYIENGIKSMSLETFVDIANALGTSANELLGDSIHNAGQTAVREINLEGCTQYERMVILDLVSALKSILHSNGRYLR